MKIQQQPDYLIFADDAKTGEVQDFPNILRGWGVTIDQTQSKPPMEWMNGAFNRVDKNMLYLLQQGVPEWNTQVLYPVGAVIKYKNILYIAKLENDNAIPSTNTTKWERLVKDATTEVAGSVKLNSAVNSTSEAEAATPKAVKAAYDLANTANTTANTAKTNAATAQTKADSAYTLANTANANATAAKSTAETDASTTVKGRVQLNSAVNSTVENQAATPKAVKIAYDLANTANTTANAALSRSTGGTVVGNTSFSGKLQQNGSDVITVANISNYQNNLGINQKWQLVSREAGVEYTNTTGRSIVISLFLKANNPILYIDGVNVMNGNVNADFSYSTIIPAGSKYKITQTVTRCAELR